MKYLSAAVALAIATPAVAFDNHDMRGHQVHGESQEAMMCCHGSAEEREACRERHRAMGHDVAECDGDHAGRHRDHHMDHGGDAHEGHDGSDDEDHRTPSDAPADDE